MTTPVRRSTIQNGASDERNNFTYASGQSNIRKVFPLPPGLSTFPLSQSQPSVLTQDDKTQLILQDILKTLQDSSVAEKEDNNVRSRFWANYSKVSKEHDDEFLERRNDDMDIVLLFSGLFSAVDTAFIIAMQPNYTNVLLSQLVQNTSPNTTISSVTGSGIDSTAATWFQGFAY
ncbi:hypothetical protein AZE42_13723, partial [Rhizopogon vesiculosus]